MDAWFHIFSSKGIGKSEVTSILLTEARICLYNLYMNGNAPLLMGIYNTYSGYYKVRRRLYVNERFVKLTLSGKNIKKMGLTKYGHLFHAWSNAKKYEMRLTINQKKKLNLAKRSLYLCQNIIICVLWWLLGFQRKKSPLVC